MIKLKNLTKTYNTKKILDNISLEISSGSIVSLLGVNGAGKTTLIKLMLGLEKPTNGEVYVNDLNPQQPHARKNIGVVPQVSSFIDEITVRETLEFIAKHYSQPVPINELIAIFNLQEFINRKTAVLSEGQKRRLAVASAFVGKPRLVFLDEPTVGMDVQSRIKLWDYIRSYRDPETTIILTTHYLEEAEALSDRILILQDGVIKADGSVDKIKLLYDTNGSLQDAFMKLTEEQVL